MTTRGVDFLENWIAKNVSGDTKPDEAVALASQCLTEAAALGITRHDIESDWISVEQAIRDAIMFLNEPGMPGD